jgi:hypothetical protein
VLHLQEIGAAPAFYRGKKVIGCTRGGGPLWCAPSALEGMNIGRGRIDPVLGESSDQRHGRVALLVCGLNTYNGDYFPALAFGQGAGSLDSLSNHTGKIFAHNDVLVPIVR